ncbi:hypothetical protein M0R04_05935 [Candidatus Dojkabacteria bacterium]|jgi:hypothetical protein|nr:hypothetical protein [Candidatus Dojkabacteria bacterium]
MKPFHITKKEAKVQEERVAKILADHLNCYACAGLDNNPFWDGIIETPDSICGKTGCLTFELKDERNKSSKTGNHFLEIVSRKVPSGILTTKADLWAILVSENELIVIPTEHIRLGVIDNKWVCKSGGDLDSEGKGTSRGLLVPITWLREHEKSQVITW